MSPFLNEFKGACSGRGRYKIELLTEGAPTARDLRNIMKTLDLAASWLEEDENLAATRHEEISTGRAVGNEFPNGEPAVTNGERV